VGAGPFAIGEMQGSSVRNLCKALFVSTYYLFFSLICCAAGRHQAVERAVIFSSQICALGSGLDR
jgi:hypothetical protein